MDLCSDLVWFKLEFQQQCIDTVEQSNLQKPAQPAAAAEHSTHQTDSVAAVVRAMM